MPLMSSTRSSAGYFSLLAQSEAPHLRRRHVDVLLRGEVAVAAEEAVALRAEVEQALHRNGLALVLARSTLAAGLVLTAASPPPTAAASVALAERLPLVLGIDAVGATLVVAVAVDIGVGVGVAVWFGVGGVVVG
jgi:hypothetical protein